MNKFHVILSIVLVCGLATQTVVCADEDRSGLINKAQKTYRTFKTDMSCLFNRKKKCTLEQKKRIAAQALTVAFIVTTLEALTGTGFLFGTKRGKGLRIKWRLTLEEKEDKDAIISFLDVYIPFFEANKDAIIQNIADTQEASEKKEVGLEVLLVSPQELARRAKNKADGELWNLKNKIFSRNPGRMEKLQVGAAYVPQYYDQIKNQMFEKAKNLIGPDLSEQLKVLLPDNVKEQFAK